MNLQVREGHPGLCLRAHTVSLSNIKLEKRHELLAKVSEVGVGKLFLSPIIFPFKAFPHHLHMSEKKFRVRWLTTLARTHRVFPSVSQVFKAFVTARVHSTRSVRETLQKSKNWFIPQSRLTNTLTALWNNNGIIKRFQKNTASVCLLHVCEGDTTPRLIFSTSVDTLEN